jgi:hypothetical protein
LFEGPNAFYPLSGILLDMLSDSGPESVMQMAAASSISDPQYVGVSNERQNATLFESLFALSAGQRDRSPGRPHLP